MSNEFKGFSSPEENWSKLPHELIAALPLFSSLGELKCVIYVLRHTWGYKEYEHHKHITTDEFMHGREKKDGTRIDGGVGMSAPTIIDGLKRAVDHGFLDVETDDSDLARIKKSYAIKLFNPDIKKFNSQPTKVLHRTEKETSDKKPKERDLLYEAIYYGQTGKEYVPGNGNGLGIIPRIKKLLVEINASPAAVRTYFDECKGAGLSVPRDMYKIQAGVQAVMDRGEVKPDDPASAYDWGGQK
jgi:hypothetical protein